MPLCGINMARAGIAETIALKSGIYQQKSTLEKILALFLQHMDHIKAGNVLMSELGCPQMMGRAFTSGTVGVPLPIR
jgi:hypothetical protein